MDNVCSFNRNPFYVERLAPVAGSGGDSGEQCRAFQIYATGASDVGAEKARSGAADCRAQAGLR